jgi:predicted ATPase/DNA-binding XRE family transcriptional regulator
MLRTLRKRARLTQRELGIAVGYSETFITRLESDDRRPDPATVKARFVAALDLQHEPRLAQQLIELAMLSRATHSTASEALPTETHTNLPASLTRFIGRQQELHTVIDLARSQRLVTLTGSGGVGKTRLAIEAGAHVLDDFRDGVLIAELAPLGDATRVAQHVAGMFKIINQAGNTYANALSVLIGSKHMLLIFDNCEHVIQGCAELVEALLRACPNLHLLATSREALNIAGEVVWRVPSMTTGESAQLFAERALAVKTDFAMSSGNSGEVAAICARLDGIPLAIELAASRLNALSLKQLAARLDDRFNLLTSGSRTALRRHQTLRALIAWSYDLLSDQERTLLRRLAVFAGGWTAEAAEGVCATPRECEAEMAALNAPNVLPLLLNLVNKSLVVANEEGEQTRYTMLETIRQFAWEQLEMAGETMFAQRQHARYCLAWLKRTAPAPMRETNNPVQLDQLAVACWTWIASLQPDRENVRAALVWSLQQSHDVETGIELVRWHKPMWTLRGPREEARRWLEMALSHAQSPEQMQDRAYLLTHLGSFLNRLGESDRAMACHRDALVIFRQLNDRFGVMYTLNQVGNIQQNGLDAMSAGLEEWLALALELNDPMHAGAALWFLGLHYARRRNDLPRALDYYAQSLRTLPEEELGLRSVAIFFQAQAMRNAGHSEGTIARIQASLAYFRRCGFVLGVTTVLQWLGNHALAECEWDLAHSYLSEGLALAYRDGAKESAFSYFGAFAALAAVEQKPEASATLAVLNRVMVRQSMTPHNQALVDAACAQLDSDSLAKAEAAGRSMTFDQAVALALTL